MPVFVAVISHDPVIMSHVIMFHPFPPATPSLPLPPAARCARARSLAVADAMPSSFQFPTPSSLIRPLLPPSSLQVRPRTVPAGDDAMPMFVVGAGGDFRQVAPLASLEYIVEPLMLPPIVSFDIKVGA